MKGIKIGFSFTLSLILVFVVLLTFACTPPSPTTTPTSQPSTPKILKIGFITSVTGPVAPGFKPLLDSVKPTQELINSKGGIKVNGQQYLIEIVTEDDQSAPPSAVAAATKLIGENVNLISAPIFAPNNMAIANTCEDAKAVRMVPNSLDPTQCAPPNQYCFNAWCPIYNIPYIYDKLQSLYPNVKRIAILRPDDPGTVIPRDEDVKEAEKRGLQVVYKGEYKVDTQDFYPILTKVLETKPDAIDMVFGIMPWTKGIVNGSRELGFTGPIYGIAPLGDNAELKMGLDPKNAYDVFHPCLDVTRPETLPIVKDLEKLVMKENPDYLFTFVNVLTLQSFMTILQGVEKAQSFDTEKIMNALETSEGIDTVLGKGKIAGKELIGTNRLFVLPVPFSRFMKDGSIEYEVIPIK